MEKGGTEDNLSDNTSINRISNGNFSKFQTNTKLKID